MANDREILLRINQLSLAIVEEMVKDGDKYSSVEDIKVIENLSRTIVDLTNIHLGKDADLSTTLKACLIRSRLSYNTVVKDNLVKHI